MYSLCVGPVRKLSDHAASYFLCKAVTSHHVCILHLRSGKSGICMLYFHNHNFLFLVSKQITV